MRLYYSIRKIILLITIFRIYKYLALEIDFLLARDIFSTGLNIVL